MHSIVLSGSEDWLQFREYLEIYLAGLMGRIGGGIIAFSPQAKIGVGHCLCIRSEIERELRQFVGLLRHIVVGVRQFVGLLRQFVAGF